MKTKAKKYTWTAARRKQFKATMAAKREAKYIEGPPGLGKTAIVKRVKKQIAAEKKPYPNPRQLTYKEIRAEIVNKIKPRTIKVPSYDGNDKLLRAMIAFVQEWLK